MKFLILTFGILLLSCRYIGAETVKSGHTIALQSLADRMDGSRTTALSTVAVTLSFKLALVPRLHGMNSKAAQANW